MAALGMCCFFARKAQGMASLVGLLPIFFYSVGNFGLSESYRLPHIITQNLRVPPSPTLLATLEHHFHKRTELLW